MMLFYKAWRESQARFLWGALALAVFCFFAWYRIDLQISFPVRPAVDSYVAYIDTEIFGSLGKGLFVLLVIFLGLGGLLRERAHHTAVFTLTLPVSRRQLFGAQIAIGLTELALLAILPALLLQPLSAMAHQSYPIREGLRFGLLRFICGGEIFALSYLLSVFVRGDYTAPIACFIALFLQAQVSQRVFFPSWDLNPLRMMDGRWAWQGSNVNDPFPWNELSILILIALIMFAVATRITERQNL
jgi:ABC-type transport system involved in multi-copper enzyme maturation permease subunit